MATNFVSGGGGGSRLFMGRTLSLGERSPLLFHHVKSSKAKRPFSPFSLPSLRHHSSLVPSSASAARRGSSFTRNNGRFLLRANAEAASCVPMFLVKRSFWSKKSEEAKEEAEEQPANVSSAASSSPQKKEEVQPRLVFASPWGTALRAVKTLSISSCLIAVSSTPVFLFFSDADVPMAGRIAVSFTVLLFSLGSTGMLSVISRNYVTHIHSLPLVNNEEEAEKEENKLKFDQVKLSTVSLTGRKKETIVDIKDIGGAVPSFLPWPNYSVKGQNYYIKPDFFFDGDIRAKVLHSYPASATSSSKEEDAEEQADSDANKSS
ncbi:hypothetical protein QOT17_004116 [Balamuthia mandrillaris]